MARPPSEQGDRYRLQILSFIVQYRRDRGYSPRLDEMQEQTRLTRTAVRHHLRMLRDADLISYGDGDITRTTLVTPKGTAFVRRAAAASRSGTHLEFPRAVTASVRRSGVAREASMDDSVAATGGIGGTGRRISDSTA